MREAEKYEDTHGGMTGDGDTIIILNLTEEEAALLEEDIAVNTHWSKFPPSEDYDFLYSIGGLLDPSIEQLSEGYYCFFNKQNDQYSVPSGIPHNFIFIEYDAVNKTLYLEEHDD